MSTSLCLRIAGVTVRVASTDPELCHCVSGATECFRVDSPDADIALAAAWGEPPGVPASPPIFDAGGHWQLYRDEGGLRFQFFAPQLGPAPYRVARFDPDFASGEILLDPRHFSSDVPVAPLEYPLDELLLANYLAEGRGIEVHACGVLDPTGRGHLFVGHSGAGKTTLARLLAGTEGLTILSDDRIILRGTPSGPWIYGTPWHGEAELASPAGGPLAGVYFLQHGPGNALAPIQRTSAAAGLFARAFPPFYRREALEFALRFCGEVAMTSPCQVLDFVPDRRVVEFLLRDAARP